MDAKSSLLALMLSCFITRSAQLRTGVAPTYIPTMRQITSYETNNIDTINDAALHMKSLEGEQYVLHAARTRVTDFRDVETANTNALTTENNQLRANLTQTKNTKVYNDDQSFREIVRNQGLEPQNVALSVTKTTQDNFIYQRNLTNGRLTAHVAETLARNKLLDAEKKQTWLSLESNERDEWYNHENSIAVEVQNPSEAKANEYYTEQRILHNGFVTDLKKRNSDLAALVPGLTTDRDNQEAAKLDEEIAKKDAELRAEAEEYHVVALQKSKAALEKLIMQYQRANSDLTTYNTHLKSDIVLLTAERDALRSYYEETTNQRNAMQIQADYFEVMLRDMKQKENAASLSRVVDAYQTDMRGKETSVCQTRNTALKSAKTSLVTTNTNLISTCY